MNVSVALPTYNGAKYLAAQLASIADQTRRPDELIITDDASTDATIEVAERFAATAPFAVRVHRNEKRLGCNGNFAHAIELCTGEVIALSDQDDVWMPRHLERLVEPFTHDERVSLVISNSDYVDEGLASMGMTLWSAEAFTSVDADRIRRGPQFRAWAKHHVVAGHACAFRASLVPAIVPFGEDTYDHWLSFVCAACGRVELIDETLTRHRHHANQAIANREIPIAERLTQQRTISTDHFTRQIETWAALRDRLTTHADRVVDPSALPTVEHRLALLIRRRAMRDGSSLSRVARACRELVMGRYHRFARGWLTFARDVYG